MSRSAHGRRWSNSARYYCQRSAHGGYVIGCLQDIPRSYGVLYLAPAKRTRSRLGYTYVSASSAMFQFRVNYRGTQLTASAVGNCIYASPWGGANWLRRTAVNRGTAAGPRCTTVYRDVIAVHHDNFHTGRRFTSDKYKIW